MVYLSPMTTSTSSSDFPAFIICCNCGHEHQAIDVEDIVIIDADGYVRPVNCESEIKPGATVLCADEEACERRMARQPQPDDELPGIDPPPSHHDGEPEEEEELDRGWYDYDDGSCEKWYD